MGGEKRGPATMCGAGTRTTARHDTEPADILAHAASTIELSDEAGAGQRAGSRTHLAVVTNGRFGSSLPARGWGTSLKRLERLRAVATRYEKLDVRYEAAVVVAALNEWL